MLREPAAEQPVDHLVRRDPRHRHLTAPPRPGAPSRRGRARRARAHSRRPLTPAARALRGAGRPPRPCCSGRTRPGRRRRRPRARAASSPRARSSCRARPRSRARRAARPPRSAADAVDRERERRHAAVHRRQAVQPDRRRQPGEEPLRRARAPSATIVVPAERLDVLDRGDEARRAARTASVPVSKRLPSGSIGAGRTLYGRHDSISSRRPNATPRCGPEVLVRRADQHVDAERRDVDRAVRRVVDGVGPGDRARLVGELGDPAARR